MLWCERGKLFKLRGGLPDKWGRHKTEMTYTNSSYKTQWNQQLNKSTTHNDTHWLNKRPATIITHISRTYPCVENKNETNKNRHKMELV